MDAVHCLVKAENLCGEGPMWDERTNRLRWVDITAGCLHAFDPMTSEHDVTDVGCLLSSVLKASDERLLIATIDGLKVSRKPYSSFKFVHDPEPDQPGNRLNDCKVDMDGRLWAGTMSIGRKGPTGALYRYGRDKAKAVQKDMTTTNGLDFSPDGKTLYVIDTFPRHVYAFDCDRVTSRLSNRRLMLSFAEEDGLPDGMCTDVDGNLWVAFWGGWRVSQFTPDGKLIRHIKLPVPQVTSCCFGGSKLDTLYITTARFGLSEEQLAAAPLSGGLFAFEPGVCGPLSPIVEFPEF